MNIHKVKTQRIGSPVGNVVRYVLLVLVLLMLAGPLVWEIALSLKGPKDNIWSMPPYLVPKDFTFSNYVNALRRIPIFTYMGNTVLVCIMSVCGNVIGASLAGYALGRLQFCGRRLIMGLVLFTMLIPGEGLIISVFLIVRSMGLQNTLIGLALPGLIGALNVLIMTNAFAAIPNELEEAAQIDGANLWQRFFNVCVPQVRGAMTVVGIFSFVGAWNDFLWPLIILSDESKYTLTVGLTRLKGTFVTDPRLIAAGAMMSLIPIIIMFICVQKYFFSGLQQGGIKG
ncbi:ABC transporter permease [Bifidobacterium hapali]|uniref:ABC transporter permease n=1 Tax=Bifidobacterium hapali TaxID=1630172 RepID=A0A261FS52_9BIFI|nr:carbohydrate ABC transporter permease [Bifidobacterium hapali]OZG61977.1 ABC transporter permease [Bifidobacterium hapali]